MTVLRQPPGGRPQSAGARRLRGVALDGTISVRAGAHEHRVPLDDIAAVWRLA